MTPRGVGCLPPRPLALHPCSDIVHHIASAIEPAELESRSERGDRPAASARGGVLPRPGWFARARGVARLGGTGTTPAWSESGRRPAFSVASRSSPRRCQWALPPCLRRGAAGRGPRRSPVKLANERKKAVRAPRAQAGPEQRCQPLLGWPRSRRILVGGSAASDSAHRQRVGLPPKARR